MRFFISALILIIASTVASAEATVYNLNAEDEEFVSGLQYPIEDHPNCDFRELRIEYRTGFGFAHKNMFVDFYMLIADTNGHLEADEYLNQYENTFDKDVTNTRLVLKFLAACDIYIVS